jgi:predicted pyridoxine 5'-phosphate oxidase superfamily flavin-nucleotide-binding protein
MASRFMQLMLTPAVQAAQDRYFGRHQSVANAQERDEFTEDEAAFIAERDSFYLSTINSDGWPYIQHRGGPTGFLKLLGPHFLRFADLKGNRQLLTIGNLAGNDRVALFLMDYPRRERLKILGHAQVVPAAENHALADQLSPAPELHGMVERLFLIDVVSFDWNCPTYITPRYSEPELEKLRDRNLVFGSRSRTSPSRFGFGAETDFRPALAEFAESPSGCQRRFGLLSLVRARFGLPGGRAGRQEARTGRLPQSCGQ